MSGSLIQFWMDAEQNSWSSQGQDEYAPLESFRHQTRQSLSVFLSTLVLVPPELNAAAPFSLLY